MARSYQLFGEFLVLVTGAVFDNQLIEWGLTRDPISVEPRFRNQDIQTDEWGPDVPIDVRTQATEAVIRMTLIHYDDAVTKAVTRQTMGGTQLGTGAVWADGVCGPSGRTMGGGVPLGFFGNRFITLFLKPARGNSLPWRFPATYMIDSLAVPLGTAVTELGVMMRAIPYKPVIDDTGTTPEILLDGAIVWDYFDLSVLFNAAGTTYIPPASFPAPINDYGEEINVIPERELSPG